MENHPLTAYDHGIFAIDSGYVRPGLASCYLVVDSGHAAFIDCGTSRSMPLILDALDKAGYRPEQVDFVIPTHVHLDHAGGAGALMAQCKNANLVVHPSGAKHLINPDRLIDSATSVYGESEFDRLFGDIIPVDKNRVLTPADEDCLRLGTRRLQFLHTPGHARHHFCILDTQYGNCFSGDTFGISYPEIGLANPQARFLLPTTTPTQFEPPAWHATLDRLMALPIQHMYLTHFGRISDVEKNSRYLQSMIERYASIAVQYKNLTTDRENSIFQSLAGLTQEELIQFGATEIDRALALLEMDLRLNAQGLEFWLQRQQ